jgi:hypothetical protein
MVAGFASIPAQPQLRISDPNLRWKERRDGGAAGAGAAPGASAAGTYVMCCKEQAGGQARAPHAQNPETGSATGCCRGEVLPRRGRAPPCRAGQTRARQGSGARRAWVCVQRAAGRGLMRAGQPLYALPAISAAILSALSITSLMSPFM